MRKLSFAIAGLLVAVLGLAGAPARAEDYPTRPIRILVPYAPGGIADIAARIKEDPSLTYKLLRYLNSAAFGLREGIRSITHALTRSRDSIACTAYRAANSRIGPSSHSDWPMKCSR